MSAIKRVGEERVEKISSPEASVHLKGTTVDRGVFSNGEVVATHAKVGSICAKYIAVSQSEVGRLLCPAGIVTVTNSRVTEKIECKILTADNCECLGSIESNGSVKMSGCSYLEEGAVKSSPVGYLIAEGSLELHDSHIEFAHVNGPAIVEDSIVDSALTFKSNRAVFKNSTIEIISMRCELEGQEQILELQNCTVAKVIFEGENGKLTLSKNSPTPIVVGGEIVPQQKDNSLLSTISEMTNSFSKLFFFSLPR